VHIGRSTKIQRPSARHACSGTSKRPRLNRSLRSIPTTIPRARDGPCSLANTPQTRGLQNRNARFDSSVPRSSKARKLRTFDVTRRLPAPTLRLTSGPRFRIAPLNAGAIRGFGPYSGPRRPMFRSLGLCHAVACAHIAVANAKDARCAPARWPAAIAALPKRAAAECIGAIPPS
jgi:hypothetical protein